MRQPGRELLRLSNEPVGSRSEMWGTGPTGEDAALLRALLDASPTATLLLDGDARVLLLNVAARQVLGLGAAEAPQALGHRAGDLFHCLNALSAPEGCGSSPECGHCVVRGSVRRACEGGEVVRARTLLRVERPAGVREAHFLVSTSRVAQGGRTMVALSLEDLSEVVKLASLLPICFHCRRVRDEAQYWRSVEEYLRTRAEIEFTHTLCEECLEAHYPLALPHGRGSP
jgi:PAS domain-containing protein